MANGGGVHSPEIGYDIEWSEYSEKSDEALLEILDKYAVHPDSRFAGGYVELESDFLYEVGKRWRESKKKKGEEL